MPTYTVTAEDHAWFQRCRRAWDYGARARSDLEPVVPAPPDAERTALLEAHRGAPLTGRRRGAARRLGRSVLSMLATGPDPDPSPARSHCRACPFRNPCVLQQRGEDPSSLLATGYRRRDADDLEEGRLGGSSWGFGRGARPVRFPGT